MGLKQLTQEQRYHISSLASAGLFQKAIADAVGVHKSTISRELRRNRGDRGYRPTQAQGKANFRRKGARKRIKLTDELKQFIASKIEEKWSPDQISGLLKKQKKENVSRERIYQFLLEDKKSGGTLYTHLRHSGKKRKKRYGSPDRRGQIKNRVSIDERPKIVEKKRRIGDWEGDTIIGKKQQKAIVTLVDRATKLTLIGKVGTKHADVVSKIIIELLSPYKEISHTMTIDNGTEFSWHEKISEALGIATYFAHPYSSWERGLNENTNGLIRQYIKKGSSFDDLSEDEILRIQNQLNDRPRKILGYRTPREVFEEAIRLSG